MKLLNYIILSLFFFTSLHYGGEQSKKFPEKPPVSPYENPYYPYDYKIIKMPEYEGGPEVDHMMWMECMNADGDWQIETLVIPRDKDLSEYEFARESLEDNRRFHEEAQKEFEELAAKLEKSTGVKIKEGWEEVKKNLELGRK